MACQVKHLGCDPEKVFRHLHLATPPYSFFHDSERHFVIVTVNTAVKQIQAYAQLNVNG
jgi:hypothetical protein